MVDAVFFDLFFTLVVPRYGDGGNEYGILNLTADEWECYAENERLYSERALGFVNDEFDIIDRIVKTGVKTGLISNADVIDCKFWDASILASFFDDAVFSCDVGLMKPDGRIYELAMNRLNVAPHHCLFVGDGGSNELSGAKEAGTGYYKVKNPLSGKLCAFFYAFFIESTIVIAISNFINLHRFLCRN